MIMKRMTSWLYTPGSTTTYHHCHWNHHNHNHNHHHDHHDTFKCEYHHLNMPKWFTAISAITWSFFFPLIIIRFEFHPHRKPQMCHVHTCERAKQQINCCLALKKVCFSSLFFCLLLMFIICRYYTLPLQHHVTVLKQQHQGARDRAGEGDHGRGLRCICVSSPLVCFFFFFF